MRRRIYFLLPDAATAHEVEKELLLARVDDHHMHFMAADETELSDLPLADFSQRTDMIPGMEHGLLLGGLVGAAAGAVVYFIPENSLMSGMGIILALGVLGAVMGAWVSGMIGISAPNSRLKHFRKPLRQGRILLMVDVPKGRVDEITRLVKRCHDNARTLGEEPTIPAFP